MGERMPRYSAAHLPVLHHYCISAYSVFRAFLPAYFCALLDLGMTLLGSNPFLLAREVRNTVPPQPNDSRTQDMTGDMN
jgi:hypothetical protein